MESPRRTIALGPFEISFRRREDGVKLGVVVSLIVHALFVALFTIAPPVHRAHETVPPVPQASPPVPITFFNPVPSQPRPRPETFSSRTPPPAAAKPLRMQPVPESSGPSKSSSDQRADAASGIKDTKPAGGEQGGPKVEPTPGAPPPASERSESRAEGSVGMNFDEPKDILGRLRDFKRAVEAPRPESPKGPKGGGRGSGGISMPSLPATGFGVGNLEFEGRDYDWEDYGRQIHGIIWRAWHNRLLITASVFERWGSEQRVAMLEHRSGVRFTILKSGQVVDVALETPSGCYPLDDSATDALREVVLPPLPEDFARDSETVHARFIAEGEIRGMKTFLQQMKNAGFF